MASSNIICAICAWKATCKKKFSLSGKDMKCVDFVRDVTIKEEESPKDDASEQGK